MFAVITGLVYLSQQNGVDASGLRMFPARFLELAGFLRVVSKREFQWRKLNRLDRVIISAYAYVTIVFVLRSALGYGASTSTMTTPLSKFGEFVDMLLMYTTCRGLIRDEHDIKWVLQRLAILLMPFVGVLLVERWTGHNPLAILGAEPRVWIDDESDRIRCFGSFSHPALLGTFGASFAVMYMGLVLASARQAVACFGVLLCVAIVILSGSGGPVTMLIVGILGWLSWPIRANMKVLRLGIFATLVVLAMIMRDPIWYLPSKISMLTGGSGWHRSYLMNQAITYIDQWWMAGMRLDLTASWFPYLVHGAADITNLYVAFGIDGGLIAMFLLIRVLVCAFGEIGRASKRFREAIPPRKENEMLAWGLGSAVAAHMANFFSITYFDQASSLWLFQLAAVSAISGMREVKVNALGKPNAEPSRGIFKGEGSRRPEPAVRSGSSPSGRFPTGESVLRSTTDST